MTIRVEHGDSREVLKDFPDGSFASIVTDPPYSLVSITKRFGKDSGRKVPSKPGSKGVYHRASRGFMGQTWDTGETAFDPEFWAEALRVLKPGGHVLAFGGTRTYHRLVCAIEDAGFEIRDSIGWLFGSGFPKSHNVSKGIDKANGDERPVLAEGAPVKRMIPGADQNKAGWEKNNGREFTPTVTAAASAASAAWEGWGTALKPAMELICVGRKPLIGTVAANVIEHGTGALNIDGCRVGVDGGSDIPSGMDRLNEANAAQGYRPGTYQKGTPEAPQPMGRWPANVVHDGSDEVAEAFPMQTSGGTPPNRPGDKTRNVYGAFGGIENPQGIGSTSGNASRFFYSAKADAADRLESKHPTVKPVDLMRWLVRLVTPPGGLVLDPFAGSGTTGMACMAEGFDALLIEREAEYVADIRRRIAHVSGQDAPLFARVAE